VAAFFVAPYARHYDFPVLLVPLFVLLNSRRLAEAAGALLLGGLLLLPYLQLAVLARLRDGYSPLPRFLLESTYFWIPLVLAVTWLSARSRQSKLAHIAPAGSLVGAVRSAE